jgi:predicted regulator of Ras-like GTPase activity (Roadblock/LC7/MglB family)
MMKRIKRLDITSIRRELQEGTEGGEAAGAPAAAPPQPAGEAVPPVGVPVRASPPQAETKGKSDIDELKAFIQRLEVLEEPVEAPPPERRVLARLGLKPPAGEAPVPPARREPEAPVPEKGKITEELPKAGEAGPVPKPPGERVVPRPAEPDTKAKIASLLRRSGLVKPPAEEPAAEPVTGIPVGPGVSEEKEEPPAPAPAEEVEIRIPKIQRKKVEITRVPRRPEKPLREPPLMDERMIQKILKQPGVIAVSTFFEGFAVQSAGRADFEQVAANAEDLFRAGKKIAREIDIGPLNQIILETGKGKLIIAPHGDLNVCIFTEPDANLGLIRVAIKSMQVEKDR